MVVEKPRPKKTHASGHIRTRVSNSTRKAMSPALLAAPGPRPRGREAVMAAVLDAAMTLFAARGPAAVSVRDIAAAAGVNHALVHRHFGTKQEVLQAVLERTVQEIAAATSEIADSRISLQQRFKVVAEHGDYWRVLARASLDNE